MNIRSLKLGLLLLLCSASVSAQTIYVSDQLETTMRRGEGTKYGIVRMLKSGTSLEVVSVNSKTGYTKVRTSGGTEGFVLSRYLMDQTSARERLEAFTANNSSLLGKISTLEETIKGLRGSTTNQSVQIESLQSEKQALSDELASLQEATADVIAIKRQNDSYSTQVKLLVQEKEELEKDNRAYRDNTKQDWFVRGAGVTILGVIIGLILPMLKRRRRWGDL